MVRYFSFLKQSTIFLSFSIASLRKLWTLWFFLPRQGKSNRNTDSTKVQYALTLTEFVFHCLPNASPRYPKKKRISCMATLMSHFPMKGQNFARFFFFIFSQCTFFPSQWSSFFSIGSPLPRFFLQAPPPLIWKENATRFSLIFLLFHPSLT